MKDYKELSRNCPPGSFPYIIKSGDTLYKLAMEYDTTVEAIMRINPGLNPNNLQIGQKICIPKDTPKDCPVGTFCYTIKQGDTLYTLAMEYNTTVEAIMKVNPGIDPNNLQIGQKICIPRETPHPGTCPNGTFAYIVKPGDTIYKLAIRYNTTVEAILMVNPGLDPDNLQVGQKICIPEDTPGPGTCPVGTFAYIVKPGDTIYNLAVKYNTTVEAILKVNPGLDPDNLRVGQKICIPRSVTPPPECDGLYYVVRPGDTLYSIAMMYNISVAELIKANPGIDPNNLRVGQLICIPKGTPPVFCPKGEVYVVKPDDTLTKILVKFNISIMDLMAGNPQLDINQIRVGQKLCILEHEDRGCPCRPGTKSYKIKRTDIPSDGLVVVALARKFDTSVSYMMKINPNLAPDDFELDKIICVPN